MRFTEKIANLPIPYILAIAAVLLIIRFALMRRKDDPNLSPITKNIAETAEALAIALVVFFLIIKPFIIQTFYIPSPSMVPTLIENDQLIANKFIYRFKEPVRGDVIVFKAPPEANMGIPGYEGVEVDFVKRVIGVPGDVVRITPGYVMIDGVEYYRWDLRSVLDTTSREDKIKFLEGKILLNGREISLDNLAKKLDVEVSDIKIMPGVVYINDKALDEPYVAEDPDRPYPDPLYGDIVEQWIVEDKHGHPSVKIPEGKLLVMGDNRNNSNDARFWGLLDRERVEGKAFCIFWPVNRMGLIR